MKALTKLIFLFLLLSLVISGCSQQQGSVVEPKFAEKQHATQYMAESSFKYEEKPESIPVEVTVETPKSSISLEDTRNDEQDQPSAEATLEFRILDTFTTEAIKDVNSRISVTLTEPVVGVVAWPYFALYIVIENISSAPGIFNVDYIISTADKDVAESQQFLVERTDEDYAELDIQIYNGTIELYLGAGEKGLAICPPGGIAINDERVPFSHSYAVIPLKP